MVVRSCTSSKPFGQKVLKIKRVFGTDKLTEVL